MGGQFYRLSEKFGYYLFVTHHAVWISPLGFLVDVTPFHSELKHQPETKSGKVIFLPDDRAKPIKKGNFIIPLPNKFFALKPGSKINEYIQNLQKKEFQYYKENFDIEF